ncbi:bifunctional PIG-L family deacetylase/class I SAM-dependent methyltransferase [Terracoccus sp. 273MFTsu3.1]|uniref:bifunctional PIG-L family deacetylase/class I SAM-dependent methyltransferase n=1 Tax=Terracoccus sp. 273MFTsu3.1 TaxID=1172188 RepID=UPI00037B41A1|nr:bifunctional PIG-L family deacetylase/class I SAM-dependent methyltransferase [Terracoccus sp. 273MFTsu3.1]
MVTRARAFTHSEPGTAETRWRERPEWADLGPADALLSGCGRLVVVAAHPDDETLAAGGLIVLAARAGLEVTVVLLTDGEASHPASPTLSSRDLATLRVEESRAALARLAPSATIERLGLPDGRLADCPAETVAGLVDVVGERGGDTVVVAPWRYDGHADHDAAGRAAGVACRRTDAVLWEYPLWLWHWCEPERAPWSDLHGLALDADVRAAKQEAVALHRTQVAPVSGEPGDEAVLHEDMLAHFARPLEVFLRLELPTDDSLDELHDSSDDPWQVRTSWYEQRKRAITLAALPRERYGRALEVGGSVGALAEDLATRCDRLVVVDESEAAVEAARSSLRGLEHVEVVSGSVPEDWPEGPFDLVVVSEVGYFLSPARLRRLVSRVDASLSDDGAVVLCHWRHPVRGWPLDGPRVHELWTGSSALPVVATHLEADFRLDVLSTSTAHRAGSR